MHKPTGKRCTIIVRENLRFFCNFGEAAVNPFTWVPLIDLIFDNPQPVQKASHE